MASDFESVFTLTTPVRIVNVDPVYGSSEVPVNQSIVITFSTPIKPGPGFNYIYDGDTWVPINKTINGNTLTLTPVGNWPYSTSQWMNIPQNGVTDLNGNPLTGDWDYNFLTVSFPAPPSGALYVTAVSPASAATNVSTSTHITITFNQNVQAGPAFDDISISGYNGTLTGYGGSLVNTISGNTLTINPVAGLNASIVYGVTLPVGAVTDGAGNNLTTEFDSYFATAGQQLTVTAVNPPDGATNVALNQTISVTFNTVIQPGPAFDYIRVYDYFGPLNTTISGNTLFIQATGGWLYNAQHWIEIPSDAVVDASGTSQTLLFSSTFWSTGAVNVTSVDPYNGATNVPANTTISLTFNTAIQPGPGFDEIRVLGYGGPLDTAISGDTLTMTPGGNFSSSFMYQVFVPAGSIESTANVSLGADFDSFFTTVGPTLSITSINPPNGATNVPVNTTITLTFNEAVQPGPQFDNISGLGYGRPINKTIAGNTLILTPATDLAFGTNYDVSVPSDAVTDIAGNTFYGNFTSSFATGGVSVLQVTNVTPASGATNVPVNTTITLTFNSNIQQGPSYANITLTSGTFTSAITGNTLTITPTSTLPYGTYALLTIPANAVINSAGTPMGGFYAMSFTTTSALTVTNVTPASGATNVPVNTTITLTFSENIQPGPGYDYIRLFGYLGGVNTTISGNLLTITP